MFTEIDEIDTIFQYKINILGEDRSTFATCNCIIYHNDKAKVLLVDDVFVPEELRQRGYGTKLMESVIQFAKKNNVDCIELVVNEDNYAAKGLYHNCGFKTSYKEQWRMILNIK